MAYCTLAHAGGILDENEFAPAGIRLLFTIVLPPYQVFLGKKQIEGLKTFEGLKIRSSGGAKELAVRKIGAVPISMSTPEVYEALRSEEHTSELQSLMRISYAVFCLKKKKQKNTI